MDNKKLYAMDENGNVIGMVKNDEVKEKKGVLRSIADSCNNWADKLDAKKAAKAEKEGDNNWCKKVVCILIGGAVVIGGTCLIRKLGVGGATIDPEMKTYEYDDETTITDNDPEVMAELDEDDSEEENEEN